MLYRCVQAGSLIKWLDLGFLQLWGHAAGRQTTCFTVRSCLAAYLFCSSANGFCNVFCLSVRSDQSIGLTKTSGSCPRRCSKLLSQLSQNCWKVHDRIEYMVRMRMPDSSLRISLKCPADYALASTKYLLLCCSTPWYLQAEAYPSRLQRLSLES